MPDANNETALEPVKPKEEEPKGEIVKREVGGTESILGPLSTEDKLKVIERDREHLTHVVSAMMNQRAAELRMNKTVDPMSTQLNLAERELEFAEARFIAAAMRITPTGTEDQLWEFYRAKEKLEKAREATSKILTIEGK